MSRDTNGKAYATVDAVKAGDVLIADGGFTCIDKDAELTVESDPAHGLYVPCRDGKHFIDGQIEHKDGVDFYIGLYPKA